MLFSMNRRLTGQPRGDGLGSRKYCAFSGDHPLHTAQRVFLLHGVLFLFGSLFADNNAIARNLTKIAIPIEDHDPLYVDVASIKKKGAVIHFKYVLDVPVFREAYAVREYRSNEVEATIDCDRQLFAGLGLTAYTGVAATGNITAIVSGSQAERAARPIDLRKGSTTGYLARYLCPRLRGAAK